MSTNSGGRNPVEALAEEFLERKRRGEPVTPEDYAERHADLADEILAVFPALLLMEDLGGDTGGQTGSIASGAGAVAGTAAGRLGEFRLVREVGRGGMGIVYEAEQESLGRRVALKVLPAGALTGADQVRRFQREARSAARLHHTNIVPVFGVGQHEGTHFYVMQFIQGQGLDAVLAELRRLRDARSPRPAEPGRGTAPTRTARQGSAADIAASLVTGRFAACADGPLPAGTATLTWSPPPSEVDGPGPPPSDPGSAGFSGPTKTSSLSDTDFRFAQSAARVGVQVAEALGYAHGQGILHRDIKPSNLLLDKGGNVWVADFGLAKAAGSDDLTHTGDIIGTVRYMAPERFRGEGDARADIYSLGLTLYELLALRPAFDDSDRASLIRQVTQEDPPPLRRLNRRVPPDLETVVHKAMAREPGQRYATATALAEDLRRFSNGEPIRARRVAPWERVVKWAKRRPALAALFVAVHVLLASLLILGVSYNLRIERALGVAKGEQAKAEAARRAGVAETYRATMSETRALRMAREPGWRDRALTNLARLAGTDTPSRDLVALRTEAVACLGESDVREEVRFHWSLAADGRPQAVWSLDFGPDGRTLAAGAGDGVIYVWDVVEKRHLRTIVDPAGDPTRMMGVRSPNPSLRFRPGTMELAYTSWDRSVRLVDLSSPAASRPLVASGTQPLAVRFDRSGRRVAVSWREQGIGVYDAGTGERVRWIPSDGGSYPIALSPDGTRVALQGPDAKLTLHPVDGPGTPRSLGQLAPTSMALEFSPDGRIIAVADQATGAVELWPVEGTSRPLSLFGHKNRAMAVAFSPDGALIASAGDDGTFRIWDVRTGQALAAVNPQIGPVWSVAFSPDGSRLAAIGIDTAVVFRLTGHDERRYLTSGTANITAALAFHPTRPLLALAEAGAFGPSGQITVHDYQTGRGPWRWTPYRHEWRNVYTLAFAPQEALLAVGPGTHPPRDGDRSIYICEAETGAVRHRLAGHGSSSGPSLKGSGEVNPGLSFAAAVWSLAFDRSGRRLASGGQDGNVIVWELDTGKALWRESVDGTAVLSVCFLDQGARLLATSEGGTLALFDLSGGTPLRAKVPGVGVKAVVTTDEHSLLATTQEGAVLGYKLPDLTPLGVASEPQAGVTRLGTTTPALSPDGQLLATGAFNSHSPVVLRDPRTLGRLFSLSTEDVTGLAFDRSGAYLAVSGRQRVVSLWNLAMIRSELAPLGLGWDVPATTPVQPPRPASDPGGFPPVAVVEVPPTRGIAAKQWPSLLRRASEHLRRGRRAEADADFAAALAISPDDPALNQDLAEAYARQGRWEASAARLSRAIELSTGDASGLLRPYALALLEANDRRGYRRLCGDLLNRFGTTTDATLAHAVARACVLDGDPSPGRATVVRLAGVAAAGFPEDQRHLARGTLGAALLRAGRYEEAIRCIDEAIGKPGGRSDHHDWATLALAYQRKGDAEAAGRWLDKLRARTPNDEPEQFWEEVEIRLLRREAEAMILDAIFPTDPFAP